MYDFLTKGDEPWTIRVDNSQIKEFCTCPQAWYNAYVLKRITANPRVGLIFGTAVHKALERRYLHDINLQDEKTSADMMHELGKVLQEHPNYPADDYRSLDYGFELLSKYNDTYLTENFTLVRTKEGRPVVEGGFEVPFGHYIDLKNGLAFNVLYTGRLDLLVEMGSGLWVMDHKTSSVFGDQLFAEMAVAPQQLGYAYAVSRIAGVLPTGFIINAIATRKPTKTGKGIEFQRQSCYINQAQVDEWFSNTAAIIQDMIRAVVENANTSHRYSCVGKYGRCQYYDVCSLPVEQRATMLSSGLFTDNTWSPLEGE